MLVVEDVAAAVLTAVVGVGVVEGGDGASKAHPAWPFRDVRLCKRDVVADFYTNIVPRQLFMPQNFWSYTVQYCIMLPVMLSHLVGHLVLFFVSNRIYVTPSYSLSFGVAYGSSDKQP